MVTPYYWILNVETSFNKDSKHDSSYYEILFPSVKPNFIGVAALIISSQIVFIIRILCNLWNLSWQCQFIHNFSIIISICGIQFWFPTYVERAMSFMFHYICMYNVLLGFETESRPLSLHIYEHQDITKLIVRRKLPRIKTIVYIVFHKIKLMSISL